MQCPFCKTSNTKVIDTNKDAHGGIRRRRECNDCHQRFSTFERAILATPLVIKRDNTRETFDRNKLYDGIRIACAKRPVSAVEIEKLVGEVESSLQKLGKPEIPSRLIGDMVIKGLKEMDQIAYIRYASVYLRFGDLQSIRSEIDRLLSDDQIH